MVSKNKLVIHRKVIFSALVRIVIFTKLEVTSSDYLVW